MALYIPHSIFHLARLLYVRPETSGPCYVQLNSTLECGERSDLCRNPFSLGERSSCFRWIAGLVCLRAGPEAADKKKLLLLPGIELQFLGRLVSNPVIILTDLPQILSVNTELCIIVRLHFLDKREPFLFLWWENGVSTKFAGSVQKLVLGLLPWGVKAAGGVKLTTYLLLVPR